MKVCELLSKAEFFNQQTVRSAPCLLLLTQHYSEKGKSLNWELDDLCPHIIVCRNSLFTPQTPKKPAQASDLVSPGEQVAGLSKCIMIKGKKRVDRADMMKRTFCCRAHESFVQIPSVVGFTNFNKNIFLFFAISDHSQNPYILTEHYFLQICYNVFVLQSNLTFYSGLRTEMFLYLISISTVLLNAWQLLENLWYYFKVYFIWNLSI